MLRLVVRRATAHWPLLAALLLVVVIGATLLGVSALLLTRTAERALEVAASRATPAEVDVTAFVGTVRGADARSVIDDTHPVVTPTLSPFSTTPAILVSSVPRSLPAPRPTGIVASTYLSAVDDLPARAELTAGRWPQGAGEAVVLESTAQQLDLTLGRRVQLGAELADFRAEPLDVVVVGIARPRPGTGWERDPLGGSGFQLADRVGPSVGRIDVFGPFLVALTDLLAGSSTIERLEVTAHPDLSHPARADLDAVAAALPLADRQLGHALGDRVKIERVASRLGLTLGLARAQRQVTAATLLAVTILGVVLTATALALAGQLTAGVRATESELVSALGASRVQLAVAATAEAGVVAMIAAALALPASSWLHSWLTNQPPLVGAGLAVSPDVTAAQMVVVLGGALALAAVLVILALRPVRTGRRDGRGLLARTGVDLLLVGFAVAGWWQLRTQPSGASSRIDAVRTLAPALLLVAGVALAVRLTQPVLRFADRLASRARGLVIPLAAMEAARRPQAVAAGLLIGLASAAGTFGLAFDATWQQSQHDQAELSVGTDLAVALTSRVSPGQGAAVNAATGGAVSPVVNQGIAVGQWLGNDGTAPRLVALDTTRAHALLRGRLDGGRTWAEVAAPLAPATRVEGLAVAAGAPLTVTGTSTGAPLIAEPHLLLQDGMGLRTQCTGEPIRLDGQPYPLAGCAGGDVVGLSLVLTLDQFYDPSIGRVTVAITGLPVAETPQWTAGAVAPNPDMLRDPAIAFTAGELRLTAAVRFYGPDAATLVATAFADPGPVPVAVSRRLATDLSVATGAPLTLTVGTAAVPVTITDVVPDVPSVAGAAAVLVDLDALTRALAVHGALDLPVTGWWVGQPSHADAVTRVEALRLGTVTTGAGEAARLVGGPVRAAAPAGLRLLVPAAALVLLAGLILHVTCDLQARAVEVARLRGLGLTRRAIGTTLVGQHAAVLLPLLGAGAGIGALATWLVVPLLIRSDIGAGPVPEVVPQWPWGPVALLIGLLGAAGLGALVAVVGVQVRRSDAAHLRVAS